MQLSKNIDSLIHAADQTFIRLRINTLIRSYLFETFNNK